MTWSLTSPPQGRGSREHGTVSLREYPCSAAPSARGIPLVFQVSRLKVSDCRRRSRILKLAYVFSGAFLLSFFEITYDLLMSRNGPNDLFCFISKRLVSLLVHILKSLL